MSNDLISRSELKKALHNFFDGKVIDEPTYILRDIFCYIDNAPTVDAYEQGYTDGWKERYGEPNDRPQGDIRWTDKLSVKSNGDIIDFEGRVVGHVNLEEMKGGVL